MLRDRSRINVALWGVLTGAIAAACAYVIVRAVIDLSRPAGHQRREVGAGIAQPAGLAQPVGPTRLDHEILEPVGAFEAVVEALETGETVRPART
mgnify:CR=1 FL=1